MVYSSRAAWEGLKFYLLPDLEKMKSVGIGQVIVSAMNQSFFTLSLGIGAMAIFGSYLEKDNTLLGESVNVAILDTFVAITAGLIIFPACFCVWCESGQRTKPDLHYIAERIHFHDRRTYLGKPVLSVYVPRGAFYRYGSIREHLACDMELFEIEL